MKLDRKQMTYVFFGGVVFVALLFYLIVISPALSKQELLAKNIVKRKQDLVRISEIKGKWQNFQRDVHQARYFSRRGREAETRRHRNQPGRDQYGTARELPLPGRVLGKAPPCQTHQDLESLEGKDQSPEGHPTGEHLQPDLMGGSMLLPVLR
ncbi:MAG: hypothetical protein H6Q40_803 [Deltaproteobacteria bacterium]|nr:hypothetical protein [Deltaproteobacteria bacterium]